jgi:hypothetical protein
VFHFLFRKYPIRLSKHKHRQVKEGLIVVGSSFFAGTGIFLSGFLAEGLVTVPKTEHVLS